MLRRVDWRSNVPEANWIAKVTAPPPTSTVACTKSGGFATPGDATVSPTGSATSAWRVLVDAAVVELGMVPPHAGVRIAMTMQMANRVAGVLMFWRGHSCSTKGRPRGLLV